jgi:hypothetical protein
VSLRNRSLRRKMDQAMKRFISTAFLVLACLVLGGLLLAYNSSKKFGPEDEPIRAIEP